VTMLRSEKRRDLSKRFAAFLEDQACSWHIAGSHFRYIVYRGRELAKVTLMESGHIYLTGQPGPLKTLLLSWFKEEQHLINDNIGPKATERLRKQYARLITSGERAPALHSAEQLPPDAIPLNPEDNQFAKLASLLGASIYHRNTSPHFLVCSNEQIVATGDHITTTLASFIQAQMQRSWPLLGT
jgi:hypothetical protein